AEDGIRDLIVTGVQTCALPIYNWGTAFTIEGYVPPKVAGLNMAAISLVEGDSFQALGIRVLRGRVLTESDNAGSPLVALVNRKTDRKSTRLNSSHDQISYAVFC